MRSDQHTPKHITWIAAGTVVALSLLTACSGGTGGTAEPPASSNPGPSSSSNSSSTTNGAPKVPAPLPTEKLIANPCSALSDDDAKAVGLAAPGKLNDITPRGCDWQSADPELKANGITISPITQNTNGLADTYSMKSSQAYFEETQIAGYPGVFAATRDSRKTGVCDLVVGVTDQLSVVIVASIVRGKNVENPCAPVAKIGTAMINHLKTES
ncbi:DUF3558 domain-containing protein [Amycolatopsis circi]|uniref:DUF3558 domain-containing protein n=1 Tax=Amycolatopsis circi TaxID=871959 RepID=UPI000E287B4F|nr:DUF3558 domain-containing protein [Amycolatopsis circi]